jgi:catechol 2,3-dioxygenase-like lactoylglutathione lyase family enzyme
MQRSLAFYKALGFTVQLYADGSQYAFLHMDGRYLHLRKAGENELSANPGGVYMYVDDVDSFHARLISGGITPLGPPQDQPWKCREFAISDPDGLLIRIGSDIS